MITKTTTLLILDQNQGTLYRSRAWKLTCDFHSVTKQTTLILVQNKQIYPLFETEWSDNFEE